MITSYQDWKQLSHSGIVVIIQYCPLMYGFIRIEDDMSLKMLKTMICPIVWYTAIIWSPYTQSQINNLETVQRKAARFVCNDY